MKRVFTFWTNARDQLTDAMKRIGVLFSVGVFLFIILPPLIVEIFFGRYIAFAPDLFINQWLSFFTSTLGLIISFMLIYVIWERKKNKEIHSVDRDILIFHLDSSIDIVNKCISHINDFPHVEPKSNRVNKNVQKEIIHLHRLIEIIKILKSSSQRYIDHDFALALDELETSGNELLSTLEEINLFTSSDSNGLNLLSDLKTLLNRHKERLSHQNG